MLHLQHEHARAYNGSQVGSQEANVSRRPHGTGSVHYDRDRDRWVGVYEAGWTPRGTRRRRKVTGKTEAEARRALIRAQREPDKPTAAARPTVRTWGERWLETLAEHVRPKTLATNASTVRRWIVPAIGHKRLDQLTPADVRSVHRAVTEAGLKPSTAVRAHAVLRWMLADAVAEGHAVPEPARATKGPGSGEVDRGVIEPADLAAIVTTIRDTIEAQPARVRWLVAIGLGVRPSEARAMTWALTDPDTGRIDISWQAQALPYRVPRDRSSGFRVPVGYEARRIGGAWHLTRPKSSAGRRLTWAPMTVRERLEAWRAACPPSELGLVFPGNGPGGVLTDADDRAAWYALCDEAGVRHPSGRPYTLYEARHSFATTASLGTTEHALRSLMGHSSAASTDAYLHADEGALRAAVEGAAKRLGIDG